MQVDGFKAARFGVADDEVERQLRAMYFGIVATQVPESALRMTDVRVRYPNSIRFGSGGFDQDLLRDQWILLPDTVVWAASGPFAPLAGPSRAVPVSTLAKVTPVR